MILSEQLDYSCKWSYLLEANQKPHHLLHNILLMGTTLVSCLFILPCLCLQV